jgi:glycerophosphoryl diester phosphodiesterase
MLKRLNLKSVWLTVTFVLSAFLLLCVPLLAQEQDSTAWILAHRGMTQTYRREGMTWTSCTASQMNAPVHSYIENTLASMKAAFDTGVRVVEIDIHPTTDGEFAVFHDWTVDCRTNGQGVTREQTMNYLKTLDLGYGYTADQGQTFPFRGQGLNNMPTLAEVLLAFPHCAFLLHIKSNDSQEALLLARYLQNQFPQRIPDLMAYGADLPIQTLKSQLPQMRTMSRQSTWDCFSQYALTGWWGNVPDRCRQQLILVPANIGPWLWGWPHDFIKHLESFGSTVVLVNDYADKSFLNGLDTPADFDKIPKNFGGGIWTDRVDLLSQYLSEQAKKQSVSETLNVRD